MNVDFISIRTGSRVPFQPLRVGTEWLWQQILCIIAEYLGRKWETWALHSFHTQGNQTHICHFPGKWSNHKDVRCALQPSSC